MRPTSDQVLTVVNTFKKVAVAKRSWLGRLFGTKEVPNRVDMNEGLLNLQGCCHGAWYGVAKGLNQTLEAAFWIDGANKLAQDLGFIRTSFDTPAWENLVNWANRNRSLWGNENGFYMFFGGRTNEAFGKRVYVVQDIIIHWMGVYDRIKALEEKEIIETGKQLQYVDITKDLAALPIQEEMADISLELSVEA